MRYIHLLLWLVSAGITGKTYAQSSPQLQWAFSSGNPTPAAAFVQSSAIAVDTAGNRYITGRYAGTADFDPSPDTFNITATYKTMNYGDDGGDIFFAKYDPNGNFLWAKTIGGPDSYYGGDSARGIIIDNSGNILIIGKRGGMFDFDPSEATAASFAEFGIFVAKYDSDGNYLSSFTIFTNKYDGLSAFTIDNLGNIYLTGHAYLGGLDFDPSGATATINYDGFSDFVAKYTSNGNYIWVKTVVGSAHTSAIVTDTAANIYLTGSFYGTADFDPSAATANLTGHSLDYQDGFIAKYDGNGNYNWAKNIGGVTGNPNLSSIALNEIGQVHIIGVFSGTVDFDPAPTTNNLTATSDVNYFMAKYDTTGNHLWANAIGQADLLGGYDFHNLAIGSGGLLHVAGNFRNTVDFDPSPATANLTALGEKDLFMAQYDTNGDYLYAKAVGGTGFEDITAIALDNNGNINSTGNFSNEVDFDPSESIQILISIGDADVFISKYTSGGTFFNAGVIGGYPTGNFAENENKVALGPTESIYVAGVFSNTVDFDPSPAKANLASMGTKDVFISKYTPAGNYIWAKSIGGIDSQSMSLTAVTVDTNDNVYISGHFYGTVDFDPSPATVSLTAGNKDLFIAKYDASGNYIWAKLIQQPNDDSNLSHIKSIATDADGNLYISGYFLDPLDFDPSPAAAILTAAYYYDIFMAKYDTDGNYLWAHAIGGNWYDQANAMCLNTNGDIYICGVFSAVVDFDPSPGTTILDGGGQNSMYFAKYNTNGELLWVKGFMGLDYGELNTITLNGNNQVYLSGLFAGSVDFDPSAGVATHVASGVDNFIAKYDANGNYIWANPIGGDSTPYINTTVVDSADNLILSGDYGIAYGSTGTTIIFDPTNPATTFTTTGGRDLFLAKYDGSGNYLWAKSAGGPLDETASSIVMNQNDEMVLTGSFMLTTDFDPSDEVSNLTAINSADMFLATYKDCRPAPVSVSSFGNALIVTTPADSYQWIDCNNNNAPVAGATSAAFTPTVSGNYAAVTRLNGCQNVSNCQTILSTPSTLANSAKLYPNPTTGTCTITLPYAYENTTIRVTDMIGKTIKKMNFKAQQECVVSLEEAANGIYWVQLQSDDQTAMFKVIKN